MRPRSLLRPALLPAAFLLAAGCGGDGADCGPSRAEVVRVIDGDTIELAGGQRVRYLMIDTPESTGGNDECYGQQAADYNAMLVAERRVPAVFVETTINPRTIQAVIDAASELFFATSTTEELICSIAEEIWFTCWLCSFMPEAISSLEEETSAAALAIS